MGMLITRYSGREDPRPEPHQPGPLRLPSDEPETAPKAPESKAEPEPKPEAKPEPKSAKGKSPSAPAEPKLDDMDEATLDALTAPKAPESK